MFFHAEVRKGRDLGAIGECKSVVLSYSSRGYLAIDRVHSRVRDYLEGRRILRLMGGKRLRPRTGFSGESLSVYR